MSLLKALSSSLGPSDRNGFLRNMTYHVAAFFPRDNRLVVSFDNTGGLVEGGWRLPWGHGLVEGLGWSHLGVMTKRNDWYRHRDIFRLLRDLRGQGFFAGFDEVVFYGASMGGYAALAFSAVHPGARVVAFAPQSTLKKRLVPFEKRYGAERGVGDWNGPWVDGAVSLKKAAKLTMFYDPRYAADANHADRLIAGHAMHLRSPYLGHKIPRRLADMGILRDVAGAAIEDRLSAASYARMLRVRRDDPNHVALMLRRATIRKHRTLALPVARDAVARWPERRFRLHLKGLESA